MPGIEKAFLIIIFIAAVAIGMYHLLRKNRGIIQILFSIISLLLAASVAIMILSVYAVSSVNATFLMRLLSAFLVLGCEISFHCIQIYPGRNIKRRMKFIILWALPGIITAMITGGTDLVVQSAVFKEYPVVTWGYLYLLPGFILVLYLLSNPLLLTVRSFYSGNRAFSREMRYVAAGLFLVVCTPAAVITWIINYTSLVSIAFYVILPGCLFMLVLVTNHAMIDPRHIDYKKYYLNLLYWVSYISGLFIPVYVLFKNRSLLFPNTWITSFWISLIIFVYMVLFFRFARPLIEKIFSREYLTLSHNFNEFFRTMPELPLTGESKLFWETFYTSYILGLKDRFAISRGFFFLYNPKKSSFAYVYGFGADINEDIIDQDSPILKCFLLFPELLYRSRLDSDPALLPYRKETLSFFKENGIEVAIPFYKQESQIAGILFLGLPEGRKSFSGSFIEALHLYRIQFQRQFSSRFIMEDIKSTQIIEHDKMVLSLVKNKIIPSSLPHISGIRISSLYINNSVLGGDYFDSVLLDDEHQAIFLCDCSYTGIDSAIIALGLYSVLHTPAKHFNTSPSTILNTMNWVMNTSSFYNRFAAAQCLIINKSGEITLSGAAHTPFIVYDMNTDEFQEFNGGGVPLGVDRNHRYENLTLRMHTNMIAMIYSEGAVTAINDSGENYGLERLKNQIRKNKNENASAITRYIFKDMESFLNGRRQQADATVIIIRT